MLNPNPTWPYSSMLSVFDSFAILIFSFSRSAILCYTNRLFVSFSDILSSTSRSHPQVCVGEFNNAIIQPVVEQQRQQQQEQKQQREQERQRQEPQQQQRQQRGEDEGECEPQEQGKFDTILMHSAMRLTDFRQAVTTACQLLSQVSHSLCTCYVMNHHQLVHTEHQKNAAGMGNPFHSHSFTVSPSALPALSSAVRILCQTGA